MHPHLGRRHGLVPHPEMRHPPEEVALRVPLRGVVVAVVAGPGRGLEAPAEAEGPRRVEGLRGALVEAASESGAVLDIASL